MAAAEQLDCPASEVVHVGDSLFHDVQGAAGAGMQAAWLVPPGHGPDRAEVPPRTIFLREVAELDAYLPCKQP